MLISCDMPRFLEGTSLVSVKMKRERIYTNIKSRTGFGQNIVASFEETQAIFSCYLIKFSFDEILQFTFISCNPSYDQIFPHRKGVSIGFGKGEYGVRYLNEYCETFESCADPQ